MGMYIAYDNDKMKKVAPVVTLSNDVDKSLFYNITMPSTYNNTAVRWFKITDTDILITWGTKSTNDGVWRHNLVNNTSYQIIESSDNHYGVQFVEVQGGVLIHRRNSLGEGGSYLRYDLTTEIITNILGPGITLDVPQYTINGVLLCSRQHDSGANNGGVWFYDNSTEVTSKIILGGTRNKSFIRVGTDIIISTISTSTALTGNTSTFHLTKFNQLDNSVTVIKETYGLFVVGNYDGGIYYASNNSLVTGLYFYKNGVLYDIPSDYYTQGQPSVRLTDNYLILYNNRPSSILIVNRGTLITELFNNTIPSNSFHSVYEGETTLYLLFSTNRITKLSFVDKSYSIITTFSSSSSIIRVCGDALIYKIGNNTYLYINNEPILLDTTTIGVTPIVNNVIYYTRSSGSAPTMKYDIINNTTSELATVGGQTKSEYMYKVEDYIIVFNYSSIYIIKGDDVSNLPNVLTTSIDSTTANSIKSLKYIGGDKASFTYTVLDTTYVYELDMLNLETLITSVIVEV